MIDPSIARSARRLRLLVIIGMALIALLYVLARVGAELGPLRVETHAARPGLLGARMVDLSLLLFGIALWRLAQMLGAIAEGPLFGSRMTQSFRGFAFWLFVATLVDVILSPMLAFVDSAQGGGGSIRLAFELRDLLLLAGALFLFLLARIMERARAIEVELEEIV